MACSIDRDHASVRDLAASPRTRTQRGRGDTHRAVSRPLSAALPQYRPSGAMPFCAATALSSAN
eukprot:1370209-Pyramimonas_sp.AAC.1